MLEKWQSGFFGRFQVVFDYLVDQLALDHTELHGMIVADATTHVPTQLQRLLSDLFALAIHLVYDLADLVRIRD